MAQAQAHPPTPRDRRCSPMTLSHDTQRKRTTPNHRRADLDPDAPDIKRPRLDHPPPPPPFSLPALLHSPVHPHRRRRIRRRSYSLPNIHLPTPTASPPLSRASTPPPPPPYIYTSPLRPLINLDTLRELDLDAILQNPQLRHDLLHDPLLQFQPTSSPRKRAATSKYWLAVSREVSLGCTCTSFGTHGELLPCICSPLPGPSSHRRGGSRIEYLIKELRDVLLSVIAPNPPPPHSSSSPSSSSSYQHTLAEVHSILDPSLISQQISHRILKPAPLFLWLGTLMKQHCAPMRDWRVERMIHLSRNEKYGVGGVEALRECFDILELMKLDIANHQLITLRPFLEKNHAEEELRAWKEMNLTPDAREEASKWIRGNCHDRTRELNEKDLGSALISSLLSCHPNYPTTLHLDTLRLEGIKRELSAIWALWMGLLAFRSLSGRKMTDTEMEDMKREMLAIQASSPPPSAGQGGGLSSEVILHIIHCSHPSAPTPSQPQIELLTSWLTARANSNSRVSLLCRKRLESALLDLVFLRPTPYSAIPLPNGYGLDPLLPELRNVSDRLASIIRVHWRVYHGVYAGYS